MKVLFINGSPKKRGGASRCFSALLKSMLAGCRITTLQVHNQTDYAAALLQLQEADAVVISTPLYIDAIPTHMLCFLQEAERVCKEQNCHFKLYVISNCGFVEGKHTALQLNMYEAWCLRAGVDWGGGLGLGGGVMLYVILLLFPISFLLHCAQIALTILQTGMITGAEVWSHVHSILTTAFLFLGLLVFDVVLAVSIRRGKSIKNLYTRALLPSFLFLFCADIFMFFGAVFKGGILRNLFRRIPLSQALMHTGLSDQPIEPGKERTANPRETAAHI